MMPDEPVKLKGRMIEVGVTVPTPREYKSFKVLPGSLELFSPRTRAPDALRIARMDLYPVRGGFQRGMERTYEPKQHAHLILLAPANRC